MAIQNILPDPTNKINAAGEVDSNGSTGPGFSGVSLTSQQPITVNRSNSGLAFRSVSKFQKFNVDIKYNSLTKDEFNVVYSFLLQRQASLEAFFVELPQYGNTSAGTKEITQDAVAGSNELTLANATNVKIGDLFSVTVPSDDTHVKVYKVTKITGNVITVSPQIQRFIDVSESGLDTVNFGQPKMRVISQGSDIQYSVDAKGLYSFSVKLEETLS
tara:strand:+ start:2170 stop:2817 length:648 start_codon:yes stop_codon:yes gene_type:complete